MPEKITLYLLAGATTGHYEYSLLCNKLFSFHALLSYLHLY